MIREMHAGQPVGVFDSGVGGLTVLDALLRRAPSEHYFYLGDTARLPYGTKSPETVRSYALEAADFLLAQAVKCIVVACNTVSALALPDLQAHCAPVSVFGVLDAGVQAVCHRTECQRLLVMATGATARSHAYRDAIAWQRPEIKVEELDCNVLVSLVEAGWQDTDVAKQAIVQYLSERTSPSSFDTVVLGCTHFPVLQPSIQAVIGESVVIVDAATACAHQVSAFLIESGLASQYLSHDGPPVQFFVTDSVMDFQMSSMRILHLGVQPQLVKHISLQK